MPHRPRYALLLLTVLGLVLPALPAARAEDPAAAPAADGTVVDASYEAPDGTTVLRQEVVVTASLEEVWSVFTTAEGWKRLGVAFAHVDFGLGGLIETSYDAGAARGDEGNIHNRILAYLPLRMIALQAEKAPPSFPAPELLPKLFSVIELEPLETGRVRITVSGVGYREGEAYDRVRAMFTQGNAWTLRKLARNLAASR